MKAAALIILTLLITSCASRKCPKAERHIAKAAWLCPDLLRPTDHQVEMPGDSADVPPMEYAQADIDSMEAACQQLAEALAGERELYAAMFNRFMQVKPSAQSAVAALRKVACKYQPFTYDHELFSISAAGGDTPGLSVHVKPRKVSVPCPPQLSPEKVTKVGVAHWYRTAFWITAAVALFLMAIIFHIIVPGLRANDPRNHG